MTEKKLVWWTAVIFTALCCTRVFADVTHTIQVDDLKRTYTVHEPAKHKKNVPLVPHVPLVPLPVVLVFHGGGSNAKAMARYSKMNDKADEAGFIAVYPSGTGRFKRILTWNSGGCCGYAQRQGVDDVKFVAAMLDDLAKRYDIDTHRVYATGMSNGAMISYRIAAELADRIAAIAPVGAAMAIDNPKPSRPVPVMHFHGTADEFAPYDGGRGKFTVSRFNHRAVNDCITQWLKINRCQLTPTVEKLADIDKEDGCTVVRESYRARKGGVSGVSRRVESSTGMSGASGAPVVVYVIQGGGHNWPGQPPVHESSAGRGRKSKIEFGASTRDIDANDEMWRFFQQFTLLSR